MSKIDGDKLIKLMKFLEIVKERTENGSIPREIFKGIGEFSKLNRVPDCKVSNDYSTYMFNMMGWFRWADDPNRGKLVYWSGPEVITMDNVCEIRKRKNHYCNYERNNSVTSKRKNKKDMTTTKNTSEKATALFDTFKKDSDGEEEYRLKHYRKPSEEELKAILLDLNRIYANLLDNPQNYKKVTVVKIVHPDNVEIVNLRSKMINPAKLIKYGACGKTKDDLVRWVGEAPNTEMAADFHLKMSYTNHTYNSRHQNKKLALIKTQAENPSKENLLETSKSNDVVSGKENSLQESKTNDYGSMSQSEFQNAIGQELIRIRQDINKFKLDVTQILKSAIAE